MNKKIKIIDINIKMTNALEVQTWVGCDSNSVLEKRTYKNTQDRWYERGFKTFHRIEEGQATRAILSGYFVTVEEKEIIKQNACQRMINRALLVLAQNKKRHNEKDI